MNRILILGLTLIPVLLNAQAEYLEKGMTGMEFYGAYGSQEDGKSFSLRWGYSPNGIFEFGAQYTRTSVDINGEDLKSNLYGGDLSFHLLKQNGTYPLALSLSAIYLYGGYSSYSLDANNLALTSNSFGLALNLYSSVYKASWIEIMPGFGLSYLNTKSKTEDKSGYAARFSYDPVTESSESTVTINLNVSLILVVNDKNKLIIFPGMTANDDSEAFVIGISFLLHD